MAFEVFDDIAFFYLALAVVAAAVLPWSLFKLFFFARELVRPAQMVPLTRIQKLKLAQSQAAGGAAGAAAVQSAAGSPDGGVASAAALAKSNAAAAGLTQESVRPPRPWLSVGNVVLLLLWVLFLFMLLQIPSFSSENLASFDPYAILKLDKTATAAQIKKAYRAQSLLYHPDVNHSPEATQQFMLVAKAHAALTSEKAKANIEKYGNPDGYQGVSVTIGLPSMLTRKENEMRVLVVYFLVFILLPPVCVWVWWRRAREYVDGGTMKKTLAMWAQLMLPNQGSKQLVEFLSIAAEYEGLVAPDAALRGAAGAGVSASAPTGPEAQQDAEEFKKLVAEVKPHAFKPRFSAAPYRAFFIAYASRASTLLHAYLLRLPIASPRMRADLQKILKDAHRLLGVMMELAWARGFVQTVFGVFDLMQLLSQGLFAHDSPLLQLPHLTAADCRKLAHKNIRTVHSLLKTPSEKLAKVLPDITPAQWESIRSVAELIPDVRVQCEHLVEGEEGLYEGDLVTVRIKMERQSFDPDKPDQPDNTRVSKHEGGEDSSSSSSASAPELAAAAAKAKDKSNKAKFASGETKKDGDAAATEGEDAPAAATAGASTDSPSPSSSPPADRPLSDDEILDSLPMPKAAPAVPDLLQSGPSVHSLTFPWPKHEKWSVILLEKSTKKADRIIALQKVPSFFDEASVELKFLAPRAQSAKELGLASGDHSGAGVVQYELHVLCDSYVGVDVVRPFSMKISRTRSTPEEHARAVKEKVAEEYKELEDDGEPELDENGNPVPRAEGLGGMLRQALEGAQYDDGKWYYLGFGSFWELVLNAVVLLLLGVFLFNFLHSRGYWQKYITPSVQFVSGYTAPVWAAAYPTLAPLVDPLAEYSGAAYNWAADMLHREPPEWVAARAAHPEDHPVDENAIPGMGQDDASAAEDAEAEEEEGEEKEE